MMDTLTIIGYGFVIGYLLGTVYELRKFTERKNAR